MLGVIHRDNEGPPLLGEWFERIVPDVITLELSHYGLDFRRAKGEEYRKKVMGVLKEMEAARRPYDRKALLNLLAFVDIPYEYEVSARYAEERNRRLYLIDMDLFSSLKLRKTEELFWKDNIEKALAEMDERPGDGEKALARLFFEKNLNVAPYTEEMYIRDRFMRDRLSTLMKYHRGRTVLHVCGWRHLQDPYGLYNDFNPIKVFIYDKTVRF